MPDATLSSDAPDNASPSAAPGEARAVASETAPKPVPFLAAARVVKAVNLDAVRFSTFSAQGLATVDTIPEAADLNGASSFVRPVATAFDETISTQTTLVFRLTGRLPDGGDVTLAVLRATIDAEYSWKPGRAAEFTEDELADFAFCYCPFHVWGYWREFVQASLARLDLPHVTIPLFLIDQAPKLVRDKLD